MFAAVKSSVPGPAFVRLPAPLMTPLIAALTALSGTVICRAAATVHAPEKVSVPVFTASPSVTSAARLTGTLTVWAVALSDLIVPPLIVNRPLLKALAAPKALSLPTATLPALRAVPPL